tara:strand:+ start:31 stop:336 length:306 start_codon:yes stop_codon:yes gene_type:complete
MALRKRIYEDKIEVVGETKAIQVRTATIVEEGTDAKGWEQLSSSFHRHTLVCLASEKIDGEWVHTDTDISEESAEVQGIANAVWTDEVKALLKTTNEASAL